MVPITLKALKGDGSYGGTNWVHIGHMKEKTVRKTVSLRNENIAECKQTIKK